MPCHNGEKTIKDAIDSVLSQTYQNWELLVIDDCSTDNSVEIVREMMCSDSRIKLLHNLVCTKKPAAPRNVGIEAATGRFIAFLDCDDMWSCSKLEHQLPLFADRKCAVVFSYYRKMDEDGMEHDLVVKSPKKVDFSRLLKGNSIGNLTGIYDTKKVGKVYQKDIHHEDYLMWLEILRKGFCALNTNSVEAVYRESGESVSGSKLSVFSWTWNIYRRELALPLPVACWNFCCYAVKGVLKKLK